MNLPKNKIVRNQVEKVIENEGYFILYVRFGMRTRGEYTISFFLSVVALK